MKILIVILFLLLPISGSGQNQNYVSLQFQERYIGLQSSRLIYDEPMLWTEAQIGLPYGFFINLWNAYGFETDITLGRSWNLLSISTSFLNFHPIKEWGESNVLIHSLKFSKGFNFDRHELKSELRIEWVWWVENSRLTNGTLVLLPNVNHEWKNLSQKVMLTWDNGFTPSGNSNKGIFLRWSGGPKWKIWKIKFGPGLTVLVPLTKSHDGRKMETSWNFSVLFKKK